MNPKRVSSTMLLLLVLLNILFLLANIEAAAAAEGIIAFESARNSKPPNRGINTTIYLINADGTNERKWLEKPSVWLPRLSNLGA